MSQERKSTSSKGSKPESRTSSDGRTSSSKRREGTEGNNATQSQPDDSKHTSMLDSGKHTEKSPYTAGAQ